MAEVFDLHSWEGWTVALLGAAIWLAPLRKRVAVWRDCVGLVLVAVTTAVSATLHGSLAHVDASALEAMAGLGAARLFVEARRKTTAMRTRRTAAPKCVHPDHDTEPMQRR